MERFCVYRPRVAYGILLLIVLAVAGVFALLQMPLWLTLIETLCLFLGGWGYITTRPAMWTSRAVKIWHDQCDPYPLLGTSEELYALARNPIAKQILLINVAAAHGEMGAYEQALELTKKAGERGMEKQPLVNQIIYYNNIAGFCTELGRLEEAGEALQQAMTLFGSLKKQKQVEHLDQITRGTRAALALAHKDYSAAIGLMRGMPENHTLSLVNKAFLRAKIHLAAGEQAAAQCQLRYVVANANRLHCRVEAEEMLAALNA